MAQELAVVKDVQVGLVVKYGRVKYLSPEGEIFLLRECRNLKYRVLILMMLDCSCRITEALNMEWRDVDFQSRMVTIFTIKDRSGSVKKKEKKKRAKDRVRLIPMTERLISEISKYWTSLKAAPKTTELIFKSPKKDGSIRRQVVDRQLKKWLPEMSAHILRHTYATKYMANEKSSDKLYRLKELLGHDSIESTQIYAHIPIEHLAKSVEAIENKSIWRKWTDEIFGKRNVNVIPVQRGLTKFHVGRKKEMKKLDESFEKRTNLLVVAPQGFGKTHLTENMRNSNILRIDELKSPKKFIGDLLIMLYKDGVEENLRSQYDESEQEVIISDKNLEDATMEQIIGMAVGNSKIENYVQRQSVQAMLDILFMATKKNEVTLLVDDVTKITQSGLRLMDKLKNHFHIIANARTVELKKVGAFSNFSVLKLEPLSRDESIQLIDLVSRPFRGRIKDNYAYRDHIVRETKGNPLYIIEMAEEFSKMSIIDAHSIRTQTHIASNGGYSLFPILVLLIAMTSVMRYTGHVTGDKTDRGVWYGIAALGMITLYLARPMISSGKRKTIE